MKEKRIDLKDVNLNDDITHTLDSGEPIIVMDGINEKYVIVDANEYEYLTTHRTTGNPYFGKVQIVAPEGFDLTGDEVEEIKKLLINTIQNEMNKNSKK